MGLSISDAIRLLMLRIADEQCLPFEVKVPNAASRKARIQLGKMDANGCFIESPIPRMQKAQP